MKDKVFYIVGKITDDKNYKTKFYNAYCVKVLQKVTEKLLEY